MLFASEAMGWPEALVKIGELALLAFGGYLIWLLVRED